MANFEYIDEVEAAKEVAQKREMENKFSVTSSERTNYWEELLKDRHQEFKVEELNALGKGKRNCNKWQVCHSVVFTCISCIDLQGKPLLLFFFG